MTKKFFTLFFLLSFSSILFGFSVNAEDITEKAFLSNEDLVPTNLLLESEYELIDENGNTLTFENEKDYELYKEHILNKNDRIDINATKKVLVSSVRKNNLWVGYHSATPKWLKTSSYTLTKGNSYSTSGSYTYSGIKLNLGFTYKTSVTTKILANASKYSRLGVWGDFTFSKYKVTVTLGGKPYTYYVAEKKRHNHYIKTKYK
ncbi:MAG TPA: hypothetical protein IAA20_07720 [Candidatus Enterococcus avicola]|uniref:DUF5626 domain-containing protein n=1 Tax=Candidatus Enterococcus avicola TaxID=2838561 RepID=A0A9D2F8B2_9ENTE|nr:hypothetical protein [Candidatus Enterococcus avicola]